MAILLVDEPPESVLSGVGLAVLEFSHGPHLLERGARHEFLRVKSGVPFGEIDDGEIERAVGGGVQCGRNPLLILQLTFDPAISSTAIGHNVGLADDARAVHAQRLEDAVVEKVAVELTGDFVDDEAERQIAKVGIVVFRPRRKYDYANLGYLTLGLV